MTHTRVPATGAVATGDPGSAVRHRGFTVVDDASLRTRNTFGVEARAARLIEIHDLPSLPAAMACASAPVLLLGEGSNVLFAADWPGTVLTVKALGVEVLTGGGPDTRIRVAAGEHWDDFVRWTLAQGHPGLENLILIPGSVGAAPMQNIGAYGVEVGEFIESVDAFDVRAGCGERFDHDRCAFAYRDSLFKHHPDRWLITHVTVRLPRAWVPRMGYAGLRDEIAKTGVARPAPIHVADAVQRLRTRKLPDPAVIGNAGSFFKNPIISPAHADAWRRTHPGIPAWPVAGDGLKVSAAALIEAAGCKGLREGDAGISNRHALVLVNHGRARGADLWAFAQRVRDRVQARYGVALEPEPRIIGLPPAGDRA